MKALDDNAVVLTGCGWLTPFGAGSVADVVEKAGQRGVEGVAGRETGLAARGESRYWPIPDEVCDSHSDLSKELRLDRGAWITAVALEAACSDASLHLGSLDGTRIGLVLGCGLAGQLGMIQFANEVREQSGRFVSPIHFPQTVGNYVAGAISRGYDIRGPNATLASGAASGLDALVEAWSLLARDEADVILAGGMEALSTPLAGGLAAPGLILSEGACLFVLEKTRHASARGVAPLATLAPREPRDQGAAGLGPREHANSTGLSPCGDGGSPGSKKTRITSVAGFRHAGAVFIEHWIGRCVGAIGAAAVAAALAAAWGREIPLIDPSDPNHVLVSRLALDERSTGEGVPAVVLADADGAHTTTLGITIHSERTEDR